jgi:hypothetical protein
MNTTDPVVDRDIKAIYPTKKAEEVEEAIKREKGKRCHIFCEGTAIFKDGYSILAKLVNMYEAKAMITRKLR